MALTLIETPGLATSNTYASLAEANTYHESHTDSAGAWAGASDADKSVALVMATRLLDALYEWAGFASDPDTQYLAWPRDGVLDFHQLSTLDADTIPQRLKEATAELARLLIASDTTADLAQSVQGLTELGVGSITLKFKEAGLASSKPIPDSVDALIPSWWGRLRQGRGSSGVYQISRY